ncbi:OX-2 membrane glycoprotein isoform X2 [Molothrus ater]|nr:OX-2 membrane glycoprotein isoform X2 [Molothrus ater]XP_036247451.1 OX-2 membrane glycoprotein isoform X2 [Molothrus ater]XP_054370052.1 OX-2 membrane glycoprotein isoform X2 [Molothrus ater]
MTLQALVFCLAYSGLGKANVVPQAGHTTVRMGDSVTLSCALTKPMDVLQVTWQKDSEELHDNIATYSETNGLRIQKPYEDRMNFTSLELNKTSITFWDTRMDDSGCYKCLFNVFPSGPLSGNTCLSVFGKFALGLRLQQTAERGEGEALAGSTEMALLGKSAKGPSDNSSSLEWGLNASVHHNISEDYLIVICNANGLPEPTITWNNLFNSTPTQKTVKHKNGIVSITSTLEIYNIQSISAQDLICKVSNTNETFEMPVKIKGEEGSSLLWLVIIVVLLVVMIVLILFWRKILCRRN